MKKVIICCFGFLLLSGCSETEKVDAFTVLNDVVEGVTYEVGDEISLSYKDYVEFNLEDDSLFEISIDTNEIDSIDYVSVGEYVITVKYIDLIVDIDIYVIDTRGPVFTDGGNVQVLLNEEVDFESLFEVFDHSEFSLVVDSSLVKLDEVGEYTIIYTATDIYGNETVVEYIISVVELTDEDELEEEQDVTEDNTTDSGSLDTGSSNSGSNSNSNSNSNSGSTDTGSNNDSNSNSGSTDTGSNNDNNSNSGSTDTGSNETVTPAGPSAALYTSSDTTAEADMLKLINEERAKVGAEALTYSSTLYSAAYIRGYEIAEVFSHTRPNGSSCFTAGTGMSGENICYSSYTSASYAINQFMNSEGHRLNMLNENFTRVAFKRCIYNGVTYWVQVFGY